MDELSEQRCEACRAGAPRVTDEEAGLLMAQVPGWEIVERDGIPRLERAFKVKNFVEALDLTVKVGGIAEEEGHHPAILTEYGKVTVSWWTHKIKGLHRNDFIMAAKTSALAGGKEG
jgi:4a-hydroxytetrahydrobiopterin dehydratase